MINKAYLSDESGLNELPFGARKIFHISFLVGVTIRKIYMLIKLMASYATMCLGDVG